jgi:hypothetical protein
MSRNVLLRVLVGAVTWWVVGALPFLLAGLRLPPQNLWDTEQLPETMPLVALPFSQYSITLLVAIGVVGAVASALTGLAAPREQRQHAVLAALAGAALAAAVALAQTSTVVRDGLDGSKRAELYFTAIVGVTVLGVVLGLVAGHAVVSGGPGSRAAALAVFSSLLSSWLGAFLLLQNSIGGGPWQAAYNAIPWVTAIVAGIGLALCPPRSGRAVLAWVAALVILWGAPALFTAVSYVAGSRAILAGSPPSEWLDAGLDVLQAALLPGNKPLGPFALTVAVGLLGLRPLRPGVPGVEDDGHARTVDP